MDAIVVLYRMVQVWEGWSRVTGMVQVWEGRRRVREGRVQWRPLGLEVREVATNAIVVRSGCAGAGAVKVTYGAGVKKG